MNKEIEKTNTKRWKLNELEKIVDNLETIMSESINRRMMEVKQDYNTVVLLITGRTIVSFKSVITLVENGYSNDALSVSRKMFEDYITLSYLKQKETDDDFQKIISDFWLDYECQKYYFMKFGFERGFNDEISEEELIEMKKNLEDKSYSGNIKKYGWSGKNSFWGIVDSYLRGIDDRTKRKLLEELCIYYKRSNMEIHTSAVSALSNITHESNKIIINLDQKVEDQGVPLYFASRLFFEIVYLFMNYYSISDNGEFSKFMDLLLYYQQEAYLKNNVKGKKGNDRTE